MLCELGELGRFQSAIGSTNVRKSKYLVDDPDSDDEQYTCSNNLLDHLSRQSMIGDIDLDGIMVSASHANMRRALTPNICQKYGGLTSK